MNMVANANRTKENEQNKVNYYRLNTNRVNTDMYNAVQEENIFKMERYMNAGFDINEVYQASTDYGASAACTLLFYAVRQFKYWAVKFLLDQDADVNIPNLLGLTPLHCIVSNRPIRAPRRLGPKWHTDQFEEMGDPHVIAQMLIEAGANLDVRTPDRMRTPLEDSLHSPDMVKLLIESGCKVHNTFHGESILLVEAAVEGGMQVVRLLMDAGVDPELRDSKEGHNALEAARHFNVTKAIPILEEVTKAVPVGELRETDPSHELRETDPSHELREKGVVDRVLDILKRLYGLKHTDI